MSGESPEPITPQSRDLITIGMEPIGGSTVAVEVPRQVVERLRKAAVAERDKALGPEFDSGMAVGLSHVIAMLSTGLEGGNQSDLSHTLTS